MEKKHDPNEKTDPDKLISGLTVREYFAGKFASAGRGPKSCVREADELIAWLNRGDIASV